MIPDNPARYRFLEDTIRIGLEEYKAYGVSRKNIAVLATLIIHRLCHVRLDEGIDEVENILRYSVKELKNMKKLENIDNFGVVEDDSGL